MKQKTELLHDIVIHAEKHGLPAERGLTQYNRAETKMYDKGFKSGIFNTGRNIFDTMDLNIKAYNIAKRNISIYHKKFPEYKG